MSRVSVLTCSTCQTVMPMTHKKIATTSEKPAYKRVRKVSFMVLALR